MNSEKFFYSMRDKKFYKQFIKMFLDDVPLGEINIALAVSSMLTHSLIEMEISGVEMFLVLDIPYQSKMLAKFVGGEIDEKIVRDGYKEKYGGYFRRDWPEVFCESPESTGVGKDQRQIP